MNAVHPLFSNWCRAVSGDAAREAANKPILRAFMVRFVRGGIVEKQFECMSEDSTAAVIQHMGAANGAAVKVESLDAWREREARLVPQFPAEPDPRQVPSACDERFSEARAREFRRVEAQRHSELFPGAEL